jgi:(S)-2-hydroxyglutarate dehydrogenase
MGSLYEYCIVGGGIVGFATAMKLIESDPGARVLLLEKEPKPGLH